MYARVTNFKVDPSRLSELSAKIEEMGPRAKVLPGNRRGRERNGHGG